MNAKDKSQATNCDITGFYVYCVRSKNEKKSRGAAIAQDLHLNGKIYNGVEFGSVMSAISYKDIEVIASNIDFSRFDEKKIKYKLQEDMRWAEKNVRLHHSIVAKAYKTGAVIPMKFGTIFKTEKSMETMLKNQYKRFKKLLAELAGKQEWGVKIYLKDEKFINFIKEKNIEIKEMENKKLTMSEGQKWYADKKLEEFVAARFDDELERQLQSIVKKLEDCSEQIIFCDLLPKEATGGINQNNVLNAACLITKGKVAYFKKMLQEIQKKRRGFGFTFIASGPWPPYNFV
ncbi:hypothetical protein A2Y83_05495 [Candidatus Falkowbacteria bacterium RBG_13_39_14]|uniref:GvpL/GvpF family gas vesicle protein n=1 Tax=Candidatus Falkowbacteria bacterium RBG_13_39_14 TaxID=1797985 RepID=A0A1F5S724_9BACT|nr:MAG: hypothetical protein A2Y83_05495 [Candidatus Falkowbacteria bacterium RBG_13_39_14]